MTPNIPFMYGRLKKLRKHYGLTLEEIGELTDSSKGYIWELEKGSINPSADKLFRISHALNVRMDYFYGQDDIVNYQAILDKIMVQLNKAKGACNDTN